METNEKDPANYYQFLGLILHMSIRRKKKIVGTYTVNVRINVENLLFFSGII